MSNIYRANFHLGRLGSALDPVGQEWIPDVSFSLDGTAEYHPWWSFFLDDNAEVQIIPTCERGKWGELKKKLLVVQKEQPPSIHLVVLKDIWECNPAKIFWRVAELTQALKNRDETVRRRNYQIKSLRSEQKKH